MNFKDINIKLNIKTFCLYEQMTGKYYYDCATEDDISKLLYCSMLVNNHYRFSYRVFLSMMEDKKMNNWMAKNMQEIYEYNMQFNSPIVTTEIVSGKTEEKTVSKMSDAASILILKYHMDPSYVMYDMEIWEMIQYFKTADELDKADMVEKRFWTWLLISPQIDTKKCKSPEKLLPFKWETDKKKIEAENDLKNKSNFITNMFDMFNKKEDE